MPKSNIDHPSLDLPVVADVLINFARKEVQVLSRGKLLWSAKDVEQKNSYPLLMPLDAFVRLSALTMACLVRGTLGGKADATDRSITPENGREFVALSASAIMALASDAGALNEATRAFMMPTTSPVQPSSPNFAPMLETWSSCVAAAIASFIQEPIQSGCSFALNIEATTGYLDILYRGKPAADGPRYKALGNSMAVNCMRWIGRRIEMVDQISLEGDAA